MMQIDKLTSINEQMTISSREIAEITEKRHDHVMRDIRNMKDELDAPKFGEGVTTTSILM